MTGVIEETALGLFDRLRKGRHAGADGGTAADQRYLSEWAASHKGVEAYVEPQTNFSDLTVVLVASDGEWTRRRVGGPAGARRLGEELGIPVYDVQRVGYPQRMRERDARQRVERRSLLEES